MSEEQLIHCSFCGRSEMECKRIISGPNDVSICSDCVFACASMLMDTESAESDSEKASERDGDEE